MATWPIISDRQPEQHERVHGPHPSYVYSDTERQLTVTIASMLIGTMRGVLEVHDDIPEIWPNSGQPVRKTERVATFKACDANVHHNLAISCFTWLLLPFRNLFSGRICEHLLDFPSVKFGRLILKHFLANLSVASNNGLFIIFTKCTSLAATALGGRREFFGRTAKTTWCSRGRLSAFC